MRTVCDLGDEWNPTQLNTDQTVKAVAVNIEKHEVNQGLIQVDGYAYLIDSVVPISKQMKIVDGDILTIKHVKEIKPGDDSIMYRVLAQK